MTFYITLTYSSLQNVINAKQNIKKNVRSIELKTGKLKIIFSHFLNDHFDKTNVSCVISNMTF